MVASDSAVDLQSAAEQFLAHTKKHRTTTVYKRYSDAMELLMTFLAVELLDPESPKEAEGHGPAGRLDELTPELLRRYAGEFLLERLSGDRRKLKRHLSALRAFVKYTVRSGLLEETRGDRLVEVVRNALTSLRQSAQEAMTLTEGEQEAQLYRVLAADEGRVDVENMVTGEMIQGGRLRNPEECPLQPDDVCLLQIHSKNGEWVVDCLGIMDSPWVPDQTMVPPLPFGMDDEEPDELEDEEALEGLDLDEDEDIDWEDLDLSAEEAMEMLALDDRYAPRQVIETIVEGYDEVRDELMEWLFDETARNVPFPGGGEQPANAARILSEMGETDISQRLLAALGDDDALGEEAPVALARLGPPVLAMVESVLREEPAREDRVSAALLCLGYFAVRHPATRARVIRRLTSHVIEEKRSVQIAIQVLTEIRATECLDEIQEASRAGRLDLEQHGYTMDLLSEQCEAPAIGQVVAEALVPLPYLYPTEEELDEFYASIDDELGDWELLDDELEDLEDELEDLEDMEDLDLDEELEGGAEPHGSSSQGATGPALDAEEREKRENGDNVIPFPPSSKGSDDK